MVPKKDSFNIVLLGAQNPSIFNQDWILQHLAEDTNSNIIVAFPLDDPVAPRKVFFDGVNLFPGRSQLLLSPEISTLEGVQKCAKILKKILELLAHTPIGYGGINFSFVESNNLTKLLAAFDLQAQCSINTSEYTLDGTKITRKFCISDGHILNLSLFDIRSGTEIGFNFHYEKFDIAESLNIFTDAHVNDRYQKAIGFCHQTYALELEEEEEEKVS